MGCDRRNPLTRNGTSQGERLLAALDPEYVRVDERDLRDLVLFAQRYSRYVKYYDDKNAHDGDWSPFFTRDVTATLAGLSAMPVGSFLGLYRGLRKWLSREDVGGSSAPVRDRRLAEHFKLLFHLPLELLQDLGVYCDLLPSEHPFGEYVIGLTERDLRPALADLIAYFRGATELPDPVFDDTPLKTSDYNTTLDDDDPARRIQLPTAVTQRIADSSEVRELSLSPGLQELIDPAGWTAFFDSVVPDPSPYVDSIGQVRQRYHQIYDALNYNLVTNAFDRLLRGFERISAEALVHFEKSLESNDRHTPHYALWLAFLRLFQQNQDHLNELTGRHLDHYYRDILRLCPRREEPDHVHLLFGLAKGKDEHLVSASDTTFKAGKDAAGKPVAYRLDEDLVVNRAKVESLKALYVRRSPPGVSPQLRPRASSVADSRDGRGADLPKEDSSWPAFGARRSPTARTGFAIADRQLFMREGTRTIELTARLATPLVGVAVRGCLKASLTTAEGWIRLHSESRVRVWTRDGGTVLRVRIRLNGRDPAIVPYQEEIHQRGYRTGAPVLELALAFGIDRRRTRIAGRVLSAMSEIRFEDLTLQTIAGGLKDFALHNDLGALDPSKAFLPFGPSPRQNSSFLLGSSELFSKKLSSISLVPRWARRLTESGFYRRAKPREYTVRVAELRSGGWKRVQKDVPLFGTEIALSDLGSLDARTAQTIGNPAFTPTSRSGFLRFRLDRSFGHARHLDDKALALVEAASPKDTGWKPSGRYNYAQGIPRDPYTPEISELRVGYRSLPAAPASFFHLHPFGHEKRKTSEDRLLPDLAYEGELYIGVADLEPPQQLSLLFQTVEGSANPLKGRTPLDWQVLVGDRWFPLEGQAVQDRTRDLTGSGIVRLAVPARADTEHRVLPSGLHWFRVAATRDADALNHIRGIHAQAASATLDDRGNDPAFAATPLPPNTISKLEVAVGAIKKIEQPYASFGGRPPEESRQFYTRASERLRHKDRGSTMWDYERLVLEHFPKIYKVKCINHTALHRDLENRILSDNEIRPGHVLVVPVPYVLPGSAGNPRRPYTDKATIVAIDAFLRARISPFVRLEVQNPKIEEIQVRFEVRFHSQIGDLEFYEKKLEDAVVGFLTPWSTTDSVDISFGGKWHKAAIVDYVEEQAYVDYVKEFEMYHRPDISIPDGRWVRTDREVIEATTARSILVSHARHGIEVLG